MLGDSPVRSFFNGHHVTLKKGVKRKSEHFQNLISGAFIDVINGLQDLLKPGEFLDHRDLDLDKICQQMCSKPLTK